MPRKPSLAVLAAEYDAEMDPGAPPWARHLHRCMHQVKGTQDHILEKLGQEPQEDGAGGSGVLGKLATLDRRIKPFEALRERARGAAWIGVPLVLVILWIERAQIARLFQVQ